MNFRVDNDKVSPRQAASEFLKSKNIKVANKPSSTQKIILGSKNFTESFILAEIFKILIENYLNIEVELKLGFGGTKLVFDALDNGDIDLYPEYTGTGFLVILPKVVSDTVGIVYQKDAVFKFVKEEFEKRYDLIWLTPLGFNNTFALMMREPHAESLDIMTITDLSDYLR